MVPKAISLYIIRELEKYINTELMMTIMNVPNENYVSISMVFSVMNNNLSVRMNYKFIYELHLQAGMFAADPQNAENHEVAKRMHDTCKKALEEIIRI